MRDIEEKFMSLFKTKTNVTKDKITHYNIAANVRKVLRIEKDVIKNYSNWNKIFTNRQVLVMHYVEY